MSGSGRGAGGPPGKGMRGQPQPAAPGAAVVPVPDLSGLRLAREPDGTARFLLGERVIGALQPGEGEAAAFAQLLVRLEAALRPPPPARAVVVYREGLLAQARAEVALDLIFVEEDPHDHPPVQLRRRQVAADPDGVAAAIAEAERRDREMRPESANKISKK